MPGDFNEDGVVNILDATLFIAEWVRWHSSVLPTFDPSVDGVFDLAPYTGTTWPDWTVQGDSAITIQTAAAFIACWIGAHSSAVGAESLATNQSVGRTIPVTVAGGSSGKCFEVSVVLPAGATFDASIDAMGQPRER